MHNIILYCVFKHIGNYVSLLVSLHVSGHLMLAKSSNLVELSDLWMLAQKRSSVISDQRCWSLEAESQKYWSIRRKNPCSLGGNM